ncbi:hypothetical protein L1987_24690 [Smallanthus sonchifolius]|uniref:Uncharacterized protein n=1 Tax=Smallanthus sonchifolius TaxID=185202 RepID=A0ACB9ILQ5_9ASTR|nr:hypothetical protein L1987_24690 [Smallanthus sonchifolius]
MNAVFKFFFKGFKHHVHLQMELTLVSDSTSLSYWLRWEFFFCLLPVLTSMIIASVLIRKYEGSCNTERAYSLYDGEAWMPCVKGLSPVWLLAFRIIASCLLLAASIADVATHGANLFYYYTQWTLILTIFYFMFGSLLSACGCIRQHNISNAHSKHTDAEKGLYVPLTKARTGESVNELGECYFSETGALYGYIFQIIFQMTAGAVMLTDGVYWLLIFPFLTIVDYEMSFLTVVVHSLNLVLLLGDTAMNSLGFPWFRISYFILFTAFYVIFEWIVHAFVATWWPYPFLNVSEQYAPMWYWVVASLHLPCYVIFALCVKTKYFILSRWFPESYQCLR